MISIIKRFRLNLANWRKGAFSKFAFRGFDLKSLCKRMFTLKVLVRKISISLSLQIIIPLILFGASIYFERSEQFLHGLLDFDAKFSTEQSVSGLLTLLQNIGVALVGAVSIVSSFMVFTMQGNVERTPHRLFKHLSLDMPLVFMFGSIFSLSLVTALVPKLMVHEPPTITLIKYFGLIYAILYLYRLSYKRAVKLVSPTQQLKIQKRMIEKIGLSHDNYNPDMTNRTIRNAKRIVEDAMVYARRYGEQGTYDISKLALDNVYEINKRYLDNNDKNIRSDDGFFQHTLDQLELNIAHGIRQQNREQIYQTIDQLTDLIILYREIVFSDIKGKFRSFEIRPISKTAVAIITRAVETTVSSDIPTHIEKDLCRLFDTARKLYEYGEITGASHFCYSISRIACEVYCKEKDSPQFELDAPVYGLKHLSDFQFLTIANRKFKGKQNVQNPPSIRDALLAFAGLFKLIECVLNTDDTVGIHGKTKSHARALSNHFRVPKHYSRAQKNQRGNIAFIPHLRGWIKNNILPDEKSESEAEDSRIRLFCWVDVMIPRYIELLKLAISKNSSIESEMRIWLEELQGLLRYAAGGKNKHKKQRSRYENLLEEKADLIKSELASL